jgi:anti-anti-sigma factor
MDGERRLNGGRMPPPRRGDGRPELLSVKAWTHTLVLTGDLHQRSAHILESEIEQLCEEGVTGIRLDLRGLASIDAVGAAVITFRAGLCTRRGYEFTLIRGQRSVQRVFEQAGVAELLPFEEHELLAAARMPAPPVIASRAGDGGEQP